MGTFVLELGSEELPANILAKLTAALKSLLATAFEENGISYGSIKTFSTPRRLAAIARDVAPFQKENEEIIIGPAVSIAFDENRQPAKALMGFCRGQNISPEDVYVQQTPKGEYVAYKRKTGGKSTAEAIATFAPHIISSLPFPKKMRWGSYDLNFARPLRWILALYDEQVLSFNAGPVPAGNLTWGHRIHGPGPFVIPNANEYEDIIKNQGSVQIDNQSVKDFIYQTGNRLAKEKNAQVVWRDSLLDEVVGLVEHPVPILGSFSPDFLDIPEEILLTSMETHQKSFGLRNPEGKLVPLFLTVLNIAPDNYEIVRNGWERVLKARLEDARFFWQEDSKTDLNNWQKKLEKVIFIARLGNMAEKEQRVAVLTRWLAEQTGLADPEIAYRAGSLSKMDLVSGIVGEFPTLQGTMGGIYARQAGEAGEVANAIAEQYLPSGPESLLPESPLGALLAIADKADTLTGCFGLGRIPSGTADPDGLRRAALGIIRIMLDRRLELSISDIFGKSLEIYGSRKWKYPVDEISGKLEEFIKGRFRNWLVSSGYNNLVVDAVLAKPYANPFQALKKIQSLQEFIGGDDATGALTLIKRMENIAKNENKLNFEWSDSLLEEEAERNLANKLKEVLPLLDQALRQEEYLTVFEKIKSLQENVNDFFNNVMILCDDMNIRANRLGLLGAMLKRFDQLADFSRLQV